MPRGDKKKFGPQWTKIGCSSFKHYLQACTTSGKKLLMLSAKQPLEYHRGPTCDEKSHGVKRITLLKEAMSGWVGLQQKMVKNNNTITSFLNCSWPACDVEFTGAALLMAKVRPSGKLPTNTLPNPPSPISLLFPNPFVAFTNSSIVNLCTPLGTSMTMLDLMLPPAQ